MKLSESGSGLTSYRFSRQGSRWLACFGDTGGSGEPGSDSDPQRRALIRDRGLKILVADDHDTFRSSLAFQLEDYGAQVHEKADGASALASADAGFDLILLDINMPGGLDGLDVCAEIRRRSLAVQVALMTADPNAERRARAEELDAPLLSKPIDPEILEEVLLVCAGGPPS